MTRVLENNLKPATHFIELWKNGFDINIWGDVWDIDCLDDELKQTFFLGLDTIAIFKIRMKPQ